VSADSFPTFDESRPIEETVVPCPTCWLLADLLPPLPYDTNHRSRCPRGHENTLVPAVLAHLRTLMAQAVDRPA